MRKVYLLVVCFIAFTQMSFSQYTWNGTVSTDYQTPANWTPARTAVASSDILTFNVASVVMVTNVPVQTIAAIKITGGTDSLILTTNTPGNILTLASATPLIYTTPGSILAGDFLTIQLSSNPSPLALSSGTFGIAPNTGGKIVINDSLIVSGGKLDFDVAGTGGATINSGGSITYNSGTFQCSTASSIIWAAGSNYYHNSPGNVASVVPASTWQTGSTCNVTGMDGGNIAPTGFTGVDFANLTWKCPSQSGNIDLLPASSTVSITGTLTIASTGLNELRLSKAGKAFIRANTFVQTGGFITLQAAPTADTTTLSILGAFTQAAGTLNGVGSSSPGTAILDLQGDVTRGSASTWQSNSSSNASQLIVQFSGTLSQSVDVSSGTWAPPASGRCNIVNLNTNFVNGVRLTGNLRVYNASSTLPATFTMGSVFTGAGGVTYQGSGSGGTTLIYSGTFFQTASIAEFPVSNGPSNLTINNPLGVGFPSTFVNRTISGTLTMLNGNLAIGAGDTLLLTNTTLANQIVNTSGYVTTGTLGRYFPATGLPTTLGTSARFPFGSGVNNRALDVFFSSASVSTAGVIYVSHFPIVGVTSPLSIPDNGITLDKRTNTYWQISTGAFTLGAATISLSATGGNIGAVDDYLQLRLTDGSASYGTLISPNTGTNAVPVTGKTGLVMTDLNKPIYIGSNGLSSFNPLTIITFIWTGAGADNNWNNAANWTGINAVGFPSASTEIAVISGPASRQPTITNATPISVFQLTVSSGMTLTMASNAVLNVYDTVNFTGHAVFAPTSTFGYYSSNNDQYVFDLDQPYGNLTLSGTSKKYLAPSLTVTGNYLISGYPPIIGNNTFIYAGTGAQRVLATSYYNLTIRNGRAGQTISLGNNIAANTIDVNNIFDVSQLSNYNVNNNFNVFNFSDTNITNVSHSQPIPGFNYAQITNSNGNRTLDPLGSSDTNHVIRCKSFVRGTVNNAPGVYTVLNSKVKFYPSGSASTNYTYVGYTYYDLEISGDLGGNTLDFFNGNRVSIAGTFTMSATNFVQGTGNIYDFVFNGTSDQTIPAFKYVNSKTAAFKYSNVFIAGGNRNVTLGGGTADTIFITGKLAPEMLPPATTSSFASGKGFIVASSTVNFSRAGSTIPLLKPLVPGGYNYNNIVVSGGTRILVGDTVNIGGNVSVKGTSDLDAATLTIGKGNFTGGPRIVNVLGNMSVSGTGTGAQPTGQIDMNTGTSGITKVNLKGNLSITGYGQLMGTTSDGSNNGLIIFNGTIPQTYTNTSTFKNGLVNFTVGDGTTTSKLTLLSTLNLLANNGAISPNRDTLIINNNASLDCGTNNITANSAGFGNATFYLNAGATLVTANTGGVEGSAINSSTGSIINDASIVKTYSPLANYVFNAAANTNMSFPLSVTPFPMASLTVGDNVNAAEFFLNKSIDVSNTLTLRNVSTLAVANSHLNLKSTAASTASIAPVPDNASITYGTGRFVVERYYPGRRAWRLITAPVTADASSTVFNAWQMGGATTSGSGTFITGPGANPAANGLDVSPQNNYSLKVYNPASGLLVGVPNTYNQKISGTAGIQGTPDNVGMFLFVRGDRSTTNLFNTWFWNSTTLRDTGKVQIHSQAFKLNAPINGFDVIGNPYASTVNIRDLVNGTPNVTPNAFWVYDPYLNAQEGGYVAMSFVGGVWVPSHSTTLNENIQSSQAFFIQKSSSSEASMVFNETDKSTSGNLNAFRTTSQGALFSTSLYLDEGNQNLVLADGNFVAFDGSYNSGVDNQDLAKFGNTKENFYLLRDTKSLAVEKRQPVTSNDTIFFRLTKTTQRNYQFQFVPTNMDPLLTAYLEDTYTGKQAPVSVTSASTFSFSINGDPKSADPNRFRIVFKPAQILPVAYRSIKAYQKAADIAVEWTVENEVNISKYGVEKSTDGVNFSRINTSLAKASNGSAVYGFTDVKALPGNNFYRIASYNKTGAIEYSRTVLVKMGKATQGLSVYPNPVTGSSIGLAFNNMKEGQYNIKLINTVGQTLLIQQINHAAGSSMETLTPNSQLIPGIYHLEIRSPGNHVTSIKVIAQ